MQITRRWVESLTGCRVRNLGLYEMALVHKSALKERGYAVSNERLEFLGDSVISIIVAHYVYNNYANEDEGFMTRLRTKIVNGKTLAKLGRAIRLPDYIIMNQKALQQQWNNNEKIVENVLEAFVGAMYEDLGLEVCTTFFLNLLNTVLTKSEMLTDTNYKDILMRHMQTAKLGSPQYTQAQSADAVLFYMIVNIGNNVCKMGVGKTKKEAEQSAAYMALCHLGVTHESICR